ncbi:hypothetical protein [Cellulophaga tyrosinoxydans]|nr:hypothetical protein [Cellulophaga tyrosinoxydans]
MYEEIEDLKQKLYILREVLLNSKFSNIRKDRAIETVNVLLDNVNHHKTRALIIEHLDSLFNQFSDIEVNYDNSDLSNIIHTLEYLRDRLNMSDSYRNNSINSEEYYSKKINELESREAELRKFLEYNKNETEEQRRLAIETNEQLKVIENELNKKKKELELKEKQEDAKNDWEQKINETFDNLKEYLKPIENEHKRLNILYYAYAILCIITLILIVICEITLLYKISNSVELPKLNEYLIILLPLPIAGALMWGFIFQMNRAQRQLIAISNNIHSIKYIQGLLLSINNLSLDINDGITRVNSALDKIISNHLNRKVISNEVDLISEEGKDKIEIDKILKIISTVKK